MSVSHIPLLDKTTAISELGDSHLFELMLGEFIEISLDKSLSHICAALEAFDYSSVRFYCNSLKSSASYVHAERIKYFARKVSEDVESQDLPSLIKHYAGLVKHCIDFKARAERVVCSTHSCVEPETTPLAKFYKLVKNEKGDFDVILGPSMEYFPQILENGSASSQISGSFSSGSTATPSKAGKKGSDVKKKVVPVKRIGVSSSGKLQNDLEKAKQGTRRSKTPSGTAGKVKVEKEKIGGDCRCIIF